MRDPEVTLLVGAKKHGKSTLAAELVWKLPSPNAMVYKVGQSVLDKAFHKFRHMGATYTGGKVIVNGGQIPYLPFLRIAYEQFRHGALVIDDCRFHEGDKLSPELEKLAMMCRFLDVDLILIFHGLKSVPVKLFTYANSIYLFHTTDNPESKLNAIPEGEELLRARARIARQVAQGRRFWREKIILS